MWEFVMFMSIVSTPFVGLGGVRIHQRRKKKEEAKADLHEYKVHFPDAYSKLSGLYPVSHILMGVEAEFQPWMGEVKRYEGNFIESEEIREQFWLNLALVNEKYERFLYEVKEYDEFHMVKSDSFNLHHRRQLMALQNEILERCHDCFEMMKEDSVTEREERLAIGVKASTEESSEPHALTFMAIEEKVLLNILQSPKASHEMKLEASQLLEQWKTLHTVEPQLSAEEESMRIDLLTIRNSIEGKKVEINDSPVVSEMLKQ